MTWVQKEVMCHPTTKSDPNCSLHCVFCLKSLGLVSCATYQRLQLSYFLWHKSKNWKCCVIKPNNPIKIKLLSTVPSASNHWVTYLSLLAKNLLCRLTWHLLVSMSPFLIKSVWCDQNHPNTFKTMFKLLARLQRCIGIIASLDWLLTTIGKHR